MKKRRLCMVCLLLGFSMLNIRAVEQKALVVELQDGSKSLFVLSEKPEMTFANHVLKILMSGKSTDYEIYRVKQFYFDDSTNRISPLMANEFHIVSQSSEKITVEGIGENDQVGLYSVNGMELKNRVSVGKNQADISLARLPKGTYIINVSNKKSFKIVVK